MSQYRLTLPNGTKRYIQSKDYDRFGVDKLATAFPGATLHAEDPVSGDEYEWGVEDLKHSDFYGLRPRSYDNIDADAQKQKTDDVNPTDDEIVDEPQSSTTGNGGKPQSLTTGNSGATSAKGADANTQKQSQDPYGVMNEGMPAGESSAMKQGTDGGGTNGETIGNFSGRDKSSGGNATNGETIGNGVEKEEEGYRAFSKADDLRMLRYDVLKAPGDVVTLEDGTQKKKADVVKEIDDHLANMEQYGEDYVVMDGKPMSKENAQKKVDAMQKSQSLGQWMAAKNAEIGAMKPEDTMLSRVYGDKAKNGSFGMSGQPSFRPQDNSGLSFGEVNRAIKNRERQQEINVEYSKIDRVIKEAYEKATNEAVNVTDAMNAVAGRMRPGAVVDDKQNQGKIWTQEYHDEIMEKLKHDPSVAKLAYLTGHTVEETLKDLDDYVTNYTLSREEKKYKPNSVADYYIKNLRNSFIGRIATMATEDINTRQYAQQLLSEYEQGMNIVTAFGSEMLNMGVDMVTSMPMFGKVGGWIGQKVFSKYAYTRLLQETGLASQAAMRTAMSTATKGEMIVSRIIGSGTTFATMDATNSLMSGIQLEGKADFGSALLAGMRGFGLGSIVGTLGYGTQLWSKGAGKLSKMGIGAVGIGAEAGVFTLPEYIEQSMNEDSDGQMHGRKEGFLQMFLRNVAMVKFFKVFGEISRFRDGVKKGPESRSKIRNGFDALMADAPEMEFTADEIKAFNEQGYEGKDTREVMMSIARSAEGELMNMPKKIAEGSVMQQIDWMTRNTKLGDMYLNGLIPEVAKSKVNYFLTGQPMSASPVIACSQVYKDEDGKYVVDLFTMGADANMGQLYHRMKFESEDEAQEYRMNNVGSFEAQKINLLEGLIHAKFMADMDANVMKIAARQQGVDPKSLFALWREGAMGKYREWREVQDGKREAGEGTWTDEQAAQFEYLYAVARQMRGGFLNAADLVNARNAVARKNGLTSDELKAIIEKPFAERDVEKGEQNIVAEYIDELTRRMGTESHEAEATERATEALKAGAEALPLTSGNGGEEAQQKTAGNFSGRDESSGEGADGKTIGNEGEGNGGEYVMPTVPEGNEYWQQDFQALGKGIRAMIDGANGILETGDLDTALRLVDENATPETIEKWIDMLSDDKKEAAKGLVKGLLQLEAQRRGAEKNAKDYVAALKANMEQFLNKQFARKVVTEATIGSGDSKELVYVIGFAGDDVFVKHADGRTEQLPKHKISIVREYDLDKEYEQKTAEAVGRAVRMADFALEHHPLTVRPYEGAEIKTYDGVMKVVGVDEDGTVAMVHTVYDEKTRTLKPKNEQPILMDYEQTLKEQDDYYGKVREAEELAKVEAERKEAEEKARVEAEAKAEAERKAAEEAARKQAEEQAKAEEEARKRAEEEQKRAEEEQKRNEEAQKRAEEEAARKAAEEERKRNEDKLNGIWEEPEIPVNVNILRSIVGIIDMNGNLLEENLRNEPRGDGEFDLPEVPEGEDFWNQNFHAINEESDRLFIRARDTKALSEEEFEKAIGLGNLSPGSEEIEHWISTLDENKRQAAKDLVKSVLMVTAQRRGAARYAVAYAEAHNASQQEKVEKVREYVKMVEFLLESHPKSVIPFEGDVINTVRGVMKVVGVDEDGTVALVHTVYNEKTGKVEPVDEQPIRLNMEQVMWEQDEYYNYMDRHQNPLERIKNNALDAIERQKHAEEEAARKAAEEAEGEKKAEAPQLTDEQKRSNAAQRAAQTRKARGGESHSKEWREAVDEFKHSGYPELVEMIQDTEPKDILDVAAMIISDGDLMWNTEDVDGREIKGVAAMTGYKERDRRKFPYLFRTRKSGGISVEEAGDRVTEMCRQLGIVYDEADAMAGVNAIIEVIRGAQSVGDIKYFTEKRLVQRARDEFDDLEEEREMNGGEPMKPNYREDAGFDHNIEQALRFGDKEGEKRYKKMFEVLLKDYDYEQIDDLRNGVEGWKKSLRIINRSSEKAQAIEWLIKKTENRIKRLEEKNERINKRKEAALKAQEERKRKKLEGAAGNEQLSDDALSSMSIQELEDALRKTSDFGEKAKISVELYKARQMQGVEESDISDRFKQMIADEAEMRKELLLLDSESDELGRKEDEYRELMNEVGEFLSNVDDEELLEAKKLPFVNDSRNVFGKAIRKEIERRAKEEEADRMEAMMRQAEDDVNPNPTEAQKKAGNYKMGHISFKGFNFTIENTKGSIRSGKDADGNEWSVKMNNTYGYIRGTEGVDGDHIDVFLSDDPRRGKIFVVDQVNKDGSFDEHKVMFGFESEDEARKAYLANYSEGWHGLGKITEVSIADFKKWIDSSHRKTKPFAEYAQSLLAEARESIAAAEGVGTPDAWKVHNEQVARRGGLLFNEQTNGLSQADAAALDMFGKSIGRPIEFVTGDAFRERYGVDGKGSFDSKRNAIVINSDICNSEEALYWTMSHESTHAIKTEVSKEVWDGFVDLVKQSMGADEFQKKYDLVKNAYEEAFKAANEAGKKYNMPGEADIEEEICANWAGDINLVGDAERARDLIGKAIENDMDVTGITQGLIKYINSWLRKIKQLWKAAPDDINAEITAKSEGLYSARVAWKNMYMIAVKNNEARNGELRNEPAEIKHALILPELKEKAKDIEDKVMRIDEAIQDTRRFNRELTDAQKESILEMENQRRELMEERENLAWEEKEARRMFGLTDKDFELPKGASVGNYKDGKGRNTGFVQMEFDFEGAEAEKKEQTEDALPKMAGNFPGREESSGEGADGKTIGDGGDETLPLTPGDGGKKEKTPEDFKLRRLKSGEKCYVERRYVEDKAFTFNGKEKIESPEDIAYLFRSLEDSAIENVFFVLIKNSKATILHAGMGGLANSPVDNTVPLVAIKNINPDAIVFVHNHPSGSLKPSMDDSVTHNALYGMFGDKLRPSIIIDQKSGKYSEFEVIGQISEKERPKDAGGESVDYKVYQFSKNVFDKDYVFGENKISSSNDIAAFISSHRLGDRGKLGVLLANGQNYVTANMFLKENNLTQENAAKIADEIVEMASHTSARAAFIFGSGKWDNMAASKIVRYVKDRSGGVVSVKDALRLKGNVDDYYSMDDHGVLEEEAEYFPGNDNHAVKFALANGADEKSLVGVHNLSVDQLKRALRAGGLANPSTAVIDVLKQTFDKYGDVTLVMPKKLIEAKTGRHPGVFGADIYSPNYPTVYTRISSRNQDRLSKWILDHSGENGRKMNMMYDFMQDVERGRLGGLEYIYLKEKGVDMSKIDEYEHDNFDSFWKPYVSLFNNDADFYNAWASDKDMREKITDHVLKDFAHDLSAAHRRKIIDQKKEEGVQREDLKKMLRKIEFEAYKEAMEEAKSLILEDDGSATLTLVGDLFKKNWSAYRSNGKFDSYNTKWNVGNYIREHNLQEDYEKWAQNELDKYDPKEELYEGTDEEGNQIFVANTLRNASRIMKRQGLQAGDSFFEASMGGSRAKLTPVFKTLEQIRKNKWRLDEAAFEEAKKQMEDEYYELATLFDDGGYSFDSKFYNLSDAMLSGDAKKWAEKNGYEITDDEAARIDDFAIALKDMPTAYFELKFDRPVGFDEFVAAVVPDKTPYDVIDKLEGYGLTVHKYASEAERTPALQEVAEEKGVKFALAPDYKPKKVKTVYKMMRKYPDGSYGWLFIDRNSRVQKGSWYKGDAPEIKPFEEKFAEHPNEKHFWLWSEDGSIEDAGSKMPSKDEVNKATEEGKRYMSTRPGAKDGGMLLYNVGLSGNDGTTVAEYAFRPGIHATDTPSAGHIGGVLQKGVAGTDVNTIRYRAKDEVWMECEVPDDVDYNDEAMANASLIKSGANKGKKNRKEAQLMHMPEDGSYYYRTNTNADAIQDWIIAGAIRPVRELSDAEVAELNKRTKKGEDGKDYQFSPDAVRLSDVEGLYGTDSDLHQNAKKLMEQERKRMKAAGWEETEADASGAVAGKPDGKPSGTFADGTKVVADGVKFALGDKKENERLKNKYNGVESRKLFVDLQHQNDKDYDKATEIARRCLDERTVRLSRLGSELDGSFSTYPHIAGRLLAEWPKEGLGQRGDDREGEGNHDQQPRSAETSQSIAVYDTDQNKQILNRRAESRVEVWAKENGCWFDYADIARGKRIGGGFECEVFESTDKEGYVVKTEFVNSINEQDNLASRLDDIATFNNKAEVETVIGYTRDNNGTFCIVTEQPYIKGITVNEYFEGDTDKSNAFIDKYLESLGLEEKVVDDEFVVWTDGKFTYFDTNHDNLIIDDNGDIHIIDGKIRLGDGSDYSNGDPQAYEPFGVEDKPSVKFAIVEKNDPFYSNAAKAVSEIKQEKATPEQWLKMIEKAGGLKKGEDKWMGLSEWLEDAHQKTTGNFSQRDESSGKARTLTKDEVMDFIAENAIKIEEVNYAEGKGGVPISLRTKWWTALAIENDDYGAAWRRLLREDPTIDEDYELSYEGDIVRREEAGQINMTRLHYTTDGLTNRREIAMTVPGIEPYNEEDDVHFGDAGEGRAVVWTRFGDAQTKYQGESANSIIDGLAAKYGDMKSENMSNEDAARKYFGYYLARGKDADRTNTMLDIVYDLGDQQESARAQKVIDETMKLIDDYENEKRDKVLVVDEVQSKRHQDGREVIGKDAEGNPIRRGYRPQDYKSKYDQASKDIFAFRERMREKYGMRFMDVLQSKSMSIEEVETYNALKAEEAKYRKMFEWPADAPFDNNWMELGMKRMLRYAAENGYDKLAWTTGEQQARRYEIGGQVKSIDVFKVTKDSMTGEPIESDDYDVFATDKEGNSIDGAGGRMNAEKMQSIYGKELAKKMMDEADAANGQEVTLSGDDLYVGAEGMKGFYDQMIPKFMQKYVKKWGAKVEEVELDLPNENDRKMWSVDITPEMKESVMGGQPMFALVDPGEQPRKRRGEDVRAFQERLNRWRADKEEFERRVAAGETPDNSAAERYQMISDSINSLKMQTMIDVMPIKAEGETDDAFNERMNAYNQRKAARDAKLEELKAENMRIQAELAGPDEKTDDQHLWEGTLPPPSRLTGERISDEEWKEMQQGMAELGKEIGKSWSKKQMKKDIHQEIIERRKYIETSNLEDVYFAEDLKDLARKADKDDWKNILRDVPFYIEYDRVVEKMRSAELARQIEEGEEGLFLLPENVEVHYDPFKSKPENREVVAEIAEKVSDWFREQYELLNDEHMLFDDGQIQDYVTHIWDMDRSPKDAVDKYLSYVNNLKQQTPYAKHRVIPSYQEGLELGLVPKYNDITGIVIDYGHRATEAIANKRFVDFLSDFAIEVDNGKDMPTLMPIIVDDSVNDKDYSRFDNRVLDKKKVYKAAIPYLNVVMGRDRILNPTEHPKWQKWLDRLFWNPSSIMKKMNLSFSAFHHGALTETAIAITNPARTLKVLAKDVVWNMMVKKKTPAMVSREETRDAVNHLVSLGATSDYYTANVQNVMAQLNKWAHKIPVAGIAGDLLESVSSGMDKFLWDYIHDGYKIDAFTKKAKAIRAKAEKEGWSYEETDRALDELGQFVNDTFGGQHWDVLGFSPQFVRGMRALLLSPDWTASTIRQALSLLGFGKLYESESFWKRVKESIKDKGVWKTLKDTTPDNLRARLGGQFWASAALWFGLGINAWNAWNRYVDEDEQKRIADEKRKDNPNYRSPYEIAYPNGMKWYDYTLFGNTIGHRTHLFWGRDKEGREIYVRWGKQFRELYEYFFDRETSDFTPIGSIGEKLAGKANPLLNTIVTMISGNSIAGWINGDMKGLKGREREIGRLWVLAKSFLPDSIPTDPEKEFMLIDLVMPSSKGLSKYKARDYMEKAVLSGDEDQIQLVCQACALNGIDYEKVYATAKVNIQNDAKKEMVDGIEDLDDAIKVYDESDNPTKKEKLRQFIEKQMGAQDYTTIEISEVVDQARAFINGDVVPEEKNEEYLKQSNSDDVLTAWRFKKVKAGVKDYYDTYKSLLKEDDNFDEPDSPEAAAYLKNNRDRIYLWKLAEKYGERISSLKKKLSDDLLGKAAMKMIRDCYDDFFKQAENPTEALEERTWESFDFDN